MHELEEEQDATRCLDALWADFASYGSARPIQFSQGGTAFEA